MSDIVERARSVLSSPRNLLIAAALVVGAAGLLAVGGTGPTGSASATPTLSIAYPDYGPNPIWYPIRNGNVSSDRVDLDMQAVSPGEERRVTLSGSVDMGTMDVAGIANLHREDRLDDWVIIGSYYVEGEGGPEVDQSAMQVFARGGSGITDPSDLRGKTVALGEPGSTSNLMFKVVMAEEYGVSPDEYDILYKPESAPVLLEQGDVDAALAWTHHVVDESWRQDYVSVVDFGEDYTERYGGVPSNAVIVAREDAVRANPDRYAAVLDLMAEADDWSDRHESFIVAKFAEAAGEFDRSVWEEVWNYMDWYQPMDQDRISANNKLFELQEQYEDANGTVRMSDLYVDPRELAAR